MQQREVLWQWDTLCLSQTRFIQHCLWRIPGITRSHSLTLLQLSLNSFIACSTTLVTQAGGQDVWRNGQQCGKNAVLQGALSTLQGWDSYHPSRCFHLSTWAPSASSVKNKHFKVWFIRPGLDACFSTRWIALLVSPPPLLTIKGVQDNKIQCSYLHQECLLLLRLIPLLISGFQVTNILFNLTPPVPWSIKLGLRLTQMMDSVSQYPEINQENGAHSWRLS